MTEADRALRQTLAVMEPGEFLNVVTGSSIPKLGERGDLELDLGRIFGGLYPWTLNNEATPPRPNPAGELGRVVVQAKRIGGWDYDRADYSVYHSHRLLRVGGFIGGQMLSAAASNVSLGGGRTATMLFVGKPER